MIYIFGDSFSATREKFFYPTLNYSSWVDILAERLNDKVENFSVPGCSNEYIFDKFFSVYNNLGFNDKVIICPTSKNRIWLLEQFPELSNFNGLRSLDIVSSSEKKAVEYYQKYLQHDKFYEVMYSMFILSIRELCRNTSAHILILPTFHDVIGVVGNLTDVSEQEFLEEDVLTSYYKNYDYRLNHLTEENHKILAVKVFNFFKNNTEIDLTCDFKKGIITVDNINQFKINT